MALRIGDEAPDFKAETSDGPVSFHQWLGDSWGILFSHPADHTPVCSTELGRAATLKGEFDRRGVKLIALSVDSVQSHHAWIPEINATQNCTMNFPIIADQDLTVSKLYGMIDQTQTQPSGLPQTVRSVFIIGPDKKVKLIMTYPASTGRSFDEILRVVDSLQLTLHKKVATPVDWKQGQDVMILPTVSDADADQLFPRGYKKVLPYMRITPQPE